MFVDADLFVSQCNEEGLVINNDRADVKDRVRGCDLLLHLAGRCMPDLKLRIKKQLQASTVYCWSTKVSQSQSKFIDLLQYQPQLLSTLLMATNSVECSHVKDANPSLLFCL